MTPTDITENIISDTPRKLSPLGAQVGRVVPAETILVTCIASIGKNTMLANTGGFQSADQWPCAQQAEIRSIFSADGKLPLVCENEARSGCWNDADCQQK